MLVLRFGRTVHRSLVPMCREHAEEAIQKLTNFVDLDDRYKEESAKRKRVRE